MPQATSVQPAIRLNRAIAGERMPVEHDPPRVPDAVLGYPIGLQYKPIRW